MAAAPPVPGDMEKALPGLALVVLTAVVLISDVRIFRRGFPQTATSPRERRIQVGGLVLLNAAPFLLALLLARSS